MKTLRSPYDAGAAGGSRQERVEPAPERATLGFRGAHRAALTARCGRATLAREHLPRERQVPLRALRLHVVEERRLAVRRRLAQAHVARDDRVEHAEVALHLVGDLVGEVVARIEHGEDDALELEPRVHAPATRSMVAIRCVSPSSA